MSTKPQTRQTRRPASPPPSDHAPIPPEVDLLDKALDDLDCLEIKRSLQIVVRKVMPLRGPAFVGAMLRALWERIEPLHERWKVAHAAGDRRRCAQLRLELIEMLAEGAK